MFVGVGRLRTRFHARGLGEDGRCVRKRGYRLFHVVEFFLFRSFFVHSFERAVPFRAPAPARNETKMSARPQTAPRAMASSSDGASIVVADAPATIPSTESATAVVLASRARAKNVAITRSFAALAGASTSAVARELCRAVGPPAEFARYAARRVVAQGAQASRTARRRVRVRGRDCAKATVRRLERARAAGPIGEARTVEFASGGGDRARVGVE